MLSLESMAVPISAPTEPPNSIPNGPPRMPTNIPIRPPIRVSSVVLMPVSNPSQVTVWPFFFLTSAIWVMVQDWLIKSCFRSENAR